MNPSNYFGILRPVLRLFVASVIWFSLSSCAALHEDYVHPDTGEVSKCDSAGFGWLGAPLAIAMQEDCKKKHRELGYITLKEYKAKYGNTKIVKKPEQDNTKHDAQKSEFIWEDYRKAFTEDIGEIKFQDKKIKVLLPSFIDSGETPLFVQLKDYNRLSSPVLYVNNSENWYSLSQDGIESGKIINIRTGDLKVGQNTFIFSHIKTIVNGKEEVIPYKVAKIALMIEKDGGNRIKKRDGVMQNQQKWEEASEKIKRLKEMLDEGLITKEDYESKKNKLLENF